MKSPKSSAPPLPVANPAQSAIHGHTLRASNNAADSLAARPQGVTQKPLFGVAVLNNIGHTSSEANAVRAAAEELPT